MKFKQTGDSLSIVSTGGLDAEFEVETLEELWDLAFEKAVIICLAPTKTKVGEKKFTIFHPTDY
jgi:hypothetical protein